MFYRKATKKRVDEKAKGDPEKRATRIANEDLSRRAYIQDRLNFGGVICMLSGAAIAIAGIFV
ncbi:hypothetical protein CIK65_00915 [Brevibacterium aurantiacum]|uniref:Uncharacterized protein n=1 Tax=Brevibacterium aurantiacum TaxID=273384 RepID=A0A2A3YZL6_BREAU|nr:hypothetical protein CIK65_00915 [Brevibacterium aurantiacum]